ncbi:MAG: hypothetical protein QOD77_1075 [Thermoplasmata archaeon]|jgi:hypothetical protein|nr:hypothetical protein [Thermoplasmata archaeon]
MANTFMAGNASASNVPRGAKPAVLLLALVLLAVPAAAVPSLDLGAASAKAVGTNTLEGGLRAFLLEANGFEGRRPAPGFHLEANAIEVQLDTENAGTANAGAPQDPGPPPAFYQDVAVDGLSNGKDHRSMVFALAGGDGPRVAAAGACFGLAPADEDMVERLPRVVTSERPPFRVGAETAVAWTDCDGSALVTVHGDFLLTLWDITARVANATETAELRTGQHPSASDPTGMSFPVVIQRTEAFLLVRNGTLTWPAPLRGASLYIDPDAAYATQGSVTLTEAAGELRGIGAPQPIGADTLVVSGALDFTVAKQPGHRLRAHLGGAIPSVFADGREALVDAPTAPTALPAQPDLLLAALLAGAILLLGFGIGAWMFPPWYYRQLQSGRGFLGLHKPENRRERRAMGYWAMARRCHDLGWHRASLRLAIHGQRLGPHILDHRLMQGLAFHSMERWNEVLRCLSSVQSRLGSPQDRAATAMLLSEACVRLGDLEEAWLWCEAASAEAPAVCQRELRNPVFAPLRGRSLPASDDRDPSVA